MTDKNKQRIEYALIAILFGAGAGWGAFQWQLGDLSRRLSLIEQRVTAIYCMQVSPEIREGCR